MILFFVLMAACLIAAIFAIGLYFWSIRAPLASPEELHNFQIHPDIPSLFKSLDGIKIHYHQVGQGPNLVFIHGLGASTFIWRKLLPELSRNFRVTAIDMPGFGRSQKALDFSYELDKMADFVCRFLTAVNVDQFSLVGSSMGANIALWITKNARERCSKVISIAPATHQKLMRHPYALLQFLAPLHYFINRATISIALKNVIQDRHLITPEMIAGYLMPFRDKGEAWRCFLKSTRVIDDHRIPHELSELNLRPEFHHRILFGDDDRVVHRWVQDELRKTLPRSEFEVLPGLGHHPFEEDPKKIATLIENFLGKQ